MHASPFTPGAQRREATPTEAGSTSLRGHNKGSEPEVDLDRLVWDPEYRKAMLPAIKRGQ